MALQVWLPLNGDLRNQGLSDLKFSVVSSNTSISSSGKIGKCYLNNSNSNGGLISDKPINLGQKLSMFCWVKMTDFYSSASLTGVLGQHRYQTCQGTGITMHYTSSTTGQLSINTGNGNGSRTYSTYYGNTTLIAGEWYHVGFTYDTGTWKLYVNGALDGTFSPYTNSNINDYIGIFCWSLSGTSGAELWSDYKLRGALNDVRIYDHCLSPKEVKEISKGLVLHYKLDDPYVESTVNYGRMSETVTIRSECVNDWSVQKLDRDTVKVTALKDNPSYAQYGDITYTLGSYKTVSAGKPCTLSCEIVDYKGSLGRIYPASGGFGAITGYQTLFNRVSRTITHSVDWTHNIIIRTSSQSQIKAGDYIVIRNTQIELKDHATPYTPNARGIQTKYDTSVYTEPDGTKWVRIVHHNNPANGLFTQGSSWGNSVYVDSNRWYDVNDTINALTKYEFMVKQKNTSSASEVKYRWVQKKSPLTATWYDVKASEVVRNTSSGYTDGGYGGLYILNSNTYLCIANASNGNWYGAFGCWTAYSGGIPGYPNTIVTSGYMDLYVRVDEILPLIYDSSGYGNHGLPMGNLIASTETSKYNTCYNMSNGNAVTTSKIPFTSLTNCTISAWIYVGNNGTSGWLPFSGQTNAYYVLATSGGTGAFYHHNIGSNTKVIYRDGTVGTTPLSTGSWHHYCISGVDLSSWTNFGIDNYPDGTYWNFTGKISDVRIYSTALSADDVKELYNTSAYIYNNGTIASLELNEGLTNIISKLEYNRQKKVWADGLSSYTQTHCQCTLTDDGYRIYRTPNLVYSSAGTVMWGGFVIDNTDNRFNLQDGHTYMLQFEVKGQTSNSVTSIYWTNLVGWGGGGLSPTPSNVISANPVTSNYNSSEWKTFTYQWTINDGVYKVCTSAYHTFEQGKTYISYKGFKYGFDYMDTGSLGTDLYIKNIRMFDITNTNHTDIMKTGIIDTNSITEEILPAEISMGGIVGNQIMEV